MNYFKKHASSGNIKDAQFISAFPNGRKLKHGGMVISFVYSPASRLSAEADIEMFMSERGLSRGTDYNIPGWNYTSSGQYFNEFIKSVLTITFSSAETCVFAKMAWDVPEDDDI